jgi:2-dehydro-3-deoxyglucarate aldolase/4-hydroxy-2-oxoheptanedioate aldolase
MKNAGCEFILYDMEHSGASFETIKTQVACCRGLDIVPLVRVPRGDYHFIARALDIGCHCVMVPMVESAEQARDIVASMHYPKRGRRGAAFGFAHDDYAGGDPLAKMKAADARNIVIVQIETDKGVENVEEIAAVDGVDVLLLGHFDLTNFLGIPGQFDHPTYVSSIKRMVAAARKNKKALGCLASDPAWAKTYRKLGFNMIAAGTEMMLLTSGIRSILDPISAK